MIDHFASLESGLSTNHWLAAAAIILATFILEDAATITAGVLAVGGVIPAPVALGAVYIGIIAGDTGLYGIGRAAISTGWAQRFITARNLSQGRRWLRRRLIPALVGARFTPGMRAPTFLASGFLRISFWRFFAVITSVAAVWTTGIFAIIYYFGPVVARVHRQGCVDGRRRARHALVRHPALSAASRLAQAGGRYGPARHRTKTDRDTVSETALDGDPLHAGMPRINLGEPPLAHFEFWPPGLIYFPCFVFWALQSLRYGSLTLPTVANPGLPAGGLCGESKSELLRAAGPVARSFIAPYVKITKPAGAGANIAALEAATSAMGAAGFSFPVVGKPDIGCRGAGVRALRNANALERLRRRCSLRASISCCRR